MPVAAAIPALGMSGHVGANDMNLLTDSQLFKLLRLCDASAVSPVVMPILSSAFQQDDLGQANKVCRWRWQARTLQPNMSHIDAGRGKEALVTCCTA